MNRIESVDMATVERWLASDASHLPFAQKREVRSITSVPLSFGAFFPFLSLQERAAGLAAPAKAFLARLGKRLAFAALVPAYWLVVFRHVLGEFDIGMFTFMVGLSYVLSTAFGHWGLLEWGMR
jgi:hypothetical protein